METPRGGTPDLTNAEIESVIAELAHGHGEFALDTERAMGIRYSNRAYLVQIKRREGPIFLIDPVGIEDRLEPLGEVMHGEWILHAADQDLPSLRELGFEPTRVFDTEIAGLILGYAHVSLQAMVADVLGIALSKEHSNSDWSQRPLAPELRDYAALDVELLHELKDALTLQLKDAGRYEWFEQECEEVRTREPAPQPSQPWRKIARQHGIKDRRALAMVEQLYIARDDLAREADLAPGKILPNKVLGELAARKPRSRADIAQSPLMRSRARAKYVDSWWTAIEKAWSLPEEELPQRRFLDPNREPYPPVNRWSHSKPEAFERWTVGREALFAFADELGIRQDVLLKPAIQKLVAWTGWRNEADLRRKLQKAGARPWQIGLVAPVIDAAVKPGA